MSSQAYEIWRNFPVGSEITNLIPGSWQEAAYNSGTMRFFDPLPVAERTPVPESPSTVPHQIGRQLLAHEVIT